MKTHISTQLFLYCSGGENSVKCVRPALEMEASKEEQRGVVSKFSDIQNNKCTLFVTRSI